MIDAYLTDSVTRLAHGGTDQWGEPNAPTETVVRARVTPSTRLVRNFAGEEVVAGYELLVKDKPSPLDKFRIDGRDCPIVRIDVVKGWGVSHYRVYTA
jgi:hypothetical protein